MPKTILSQALREIGTSDRLFMSSVPSSLTKDIVIHTKSLLMWILSGKPRTKELVFSLSVNEVPPSLAAVKAVLTSFRQSDSWLILVK